MIKFFFFFFDFVSADKGLGVEHPQKTMSAGEIDALHLFFSVSVLVLGITCIFVSAISDHSSHFVGGFTAAMTFVSMFWFHFPLFCAHKESEIRPWSNEIASLAPAQGGTDWLCPVSLQKYMEHADWYHVDMFHIRMLSYWMVAFFVQTFTSRKALWFLLQLLDFICFWTAFLIYTPTQQNDEPLVQLSALFLIVILVLFVSWLLSERCVIIWLWNKEMFVADDAWWMLRLCDAIKWKLPRTLYYSEFNVSTKQQSRNNGIRKWLFACTARHRHRQGGDVAPIAATEDEEQTGLDEEDSKQLELSSVSLSQLPTSQEQIFQSRFPMKFHGLRTYHKILQQYIYCSGCCLFSARHMIISTLHEEHKLAPDHESKEDEVIMKRGRRHVLATTLVPDPKAPITEYDRADLEEKKSRMKRELKTRDSIAEVMETPQRIKLLNLMRHAIATTTEQMGKECKTTLEDIRIQLIYNNIMEMLISIATILSYVSNYVGRPSSQQHYHPQKRSNIYIVFWHDFSHLATLCLLLAWIVLRKKELYLIRRIARWAQELEGPMLEKISNDVSNTVQRTKNETQVLLVDEVALEEEIEQEELNEQELQQQLVIDEEEDE